MSDGNSFQSLVNPFGSLNEVYEHLLNASPLDKCIHDGQPKEIRSTFFHPQGPIVKVAKSLVVLFSCFPVYPDLGICLDFVNIAFFLNCVLEEPCAESHVGTFHVHLHAESCAAAFSPDDDGADDNIIHNAVIWKIFPTVNLLAQRHFLTSTKNISSLKLVVRNQFDPDTSINGLNMNQWSNPFQSVQSYPHIPLLLMHGQTGNLRNLFRQIADDGFIFFWY